MKLIRVTKDGEVFLLVAQQQMEAHDIALAVDQADIHYTLGSKGATKMLDAHGIKEVGSMRFHALQAIHGKVSTLKL